MWLLNTKTAILQQFTRPKDVPGGYAVLSHVWGNPEEEDTFHTVQAAERLCNQYNTNTGGSSKTTMENQTDVVAKLRQTVAILESMVSALTIRVERLEASSQLLCFATEADDQEQPPTSAVTDRPTSPAPSTSPRDLLSEKIRNFLIRAEQDGYDWAWADTCCIDKTSSAELTEAINSMFQYYALSEICYVYLFDVPTEDPMIIHDQSIERSRFISSQWHKRGWTLQELLAPRNVRFMSRDWTPLGNKYELADVLEGVTDIPASVFRLEEDFTTMSVATRMSWAASRRTTRVEDEAYCLLGIFGVNMPMIYGEGKNAFYRLQEEIMKSSVDSTLLAWGSLDHIDDVSQLRSIAKGVPLQPSAEYAFASSAQSFEDLGHVKAGYDVDGNQVSTIVVTLGIYAQFEWLRRYYRARQRISGIPSIQEAAAFTVTPFGLRTQLPVCEVARKHHVAFLGCSQVFSDGTTQYFVLLALREVDNVVPTVTGQGKPSTYHCSWSNDFRSITTSLELVSKLQWELKDIYISLRPPYRRGVTDPQTTISRCMAGSPEPPYHLKTSTITRWERNYGLKLIRVYMPQIPWTGSSPITLLFRSRSWTGMRLILGRCTKPESSSISLSSRKHMSRCSERPDSEQPRRLGSHYAIVHVLDFPVGSQGQPLPALSHSCEHDHLVFAESEYEERFIGGMVGGCGAGVTVLFRRLPSLDATGATLGVDFRSDVTLVSILRIQNRLLCTHVVHLQT